MRRSNTLDLVEMLYPEAINILGYDPVVNPAELGKIPGVTPSSLEDGFRNADCVIVMNNHRSYQEWSIYNLISTMAHPALFFDTWRLFEPTDICKDENVVFGTLGVDYKYDRYSGAAIQISNYDETLAD